MTPLRPFGLTCVIEQALNLGGDSGHNGAVEQQIQSAEQESTDNDGNENLYAGIDITLSLFTGDSSADSGNCGVYLVSDFLKHILLPRSFFFNF